MSSPKLKLKTIGQCTFFSCWTRKGGFYFGKILKKRNWAFVVYPESAPSDWIEQLQQRGVVGAISPLHDKDLNATENLRRLIGM